MAADAAVGTKERNVRHPYGKEDAAAACTTLRKAKQKEHCVKLCYELRSFRKGEGGQQCLAKMQMERSVNA